MTKIEGEIDKEDTKDELGHAFKSLLLDIEEVKGSEQFFTLIRGLLTAPSMLIETASTFMNDLNSLSLMHRLTGKNPTLRPDKSLIEDVYTFTVRGLS